MIVLEDIVIAPYTTFKIGGKARYFCTVSSIDELREARIFSLEKNVPIFVLGGGSNILMSDDGFDGLVIKNEIRGIHEEVLADIVRVEAGAGESWDGFVKYCVDKGYWGIENLSAIPGTVGAAPVQNIGAYGVEVKDVVESVKVFDLVSGEERVVSNIECHFGYRNSLFKIPESKRFVITSIVCTLSLLPKPILSYKDIAAYFVFKNVTSPSILDIREAINTIRASKFPDLTVFGTAGSFWKNPIVPQHIFVKLQKEFPLMPSYPAPGEMVKISLAWILDNVCGLKGYSKDSISLFKNQPLVLSVDAFRANARAVDYFAREIEEVVRVKTGIVIEREVEKIGDRA